MSEPTIIDGIQQVSAGAPAFPVSVPGCGDNGWHGISVRDYFAAQVSAALTADAFRRNEGKEMLWPVSLEEIAAKSYALADAMIAARKR